MTAGTEGPIPKLDPTPLIWSMVHGLGCLCVAASFDQQTALGTSSVFEWIASTDAAAFSKFFVSIALGMFVLPPIMTAARLASTHKLYTILAFMLVTCMCVSLLWFLLILPLLMLFLTLTAQHLLFRMVVPAISLCALAGIVLAVRAREGLRLGEGWAPWMRFQIALTLFVPMTLPVMLLVISHIDTKLARPSRLPLTFPSVEVMLSFGLVLLVSASVVFHRASRPRATGGTSV